MATTVEFTEKDDPSWIVRVGDSIIIEGSDRYVYLLAECKFDQYAFINVSTGNRYFDCDGEDNKRYFEKVDGGFDISKFVTYMKRLGTVVVPADLKITVTPK